MNLRKVIMRLFPNAVSLLCLIALIGCTTTASYISFKPREAKSPNCMVQVFMPGQTIDREFEIIGNFSAQEMGLSAGCSWEETLAKNKKHACEQGADAIQFLTVDAPSIRSTCYTSKANFISFNSTSQMLRELQTLRKDGIITEDEFQKKKQQLLEGL